MSAHTSPTPRRAHFLRLALASQDRTNTAKELAENLRQICAVDLHAVALTECNRRNKTAMAKVVGPLGYRVHDPHPASDIVFLLREDLALQRMNHREIDAANPGPARRGGHAARSIETIRFAFEGDVIVFHAAHWSTGYGRSTQRRREALEMWRAMADKASSALGPRLAFWAGDVNWDPLDPSDNKPAHIMRHRGMVSAFEELDKSPATHGKRTIDLIGSWARDKRVQAVNVGTLESPNSDHRPVVASYRIEARQA